MLASSLRTSPDVVLRVCLGARAACGEQQAPAPRPLQVRNVPPLGRTDKVRSSVPEAAPADETDAIEATPLDCPEVATLLEEGRELGCLAAGAVTAALRDIEVTPAQLDQLLHVLADAGIDLVDQEGNLGLMRAVEKFDYRRGDKY